ncbi:hypothetical protein FLV31_19600 [Cellulophaga baltica]|nr:hypothetical protein [Cellulophaga baltica]
MKRNILLILMILSFLSNASCNYSQQENKYESEFTLIINPKTSFQKIKDRLDNYFKYSGIKSYTRINNDSLFIKFDHFLTFKKLKFLLETNGLAQIKGNDSTFINLNSNYNIRVIGDESSKTNSLDHSDRSELEIRFKNPKNFEEFTFKNIGQKVVFTIGNKEILNTSVLQTIPNGTLRTSLTHNDNFNACIVASILDNTYDIAPSLKLIEHKLSFNNEHISENIKKKYKEIKANKSLFNYIDLLVRKTASKKPDLSSKEINTYFPNIEMLLNIQSFLRIIHTEDIDVFLIDSKCSDYSNFEKIINNLHKEINDYSDFEGNESKVTQEKFLKQVSIIADDYFND